MSQVKRSIRQVQTLYAGILSGSCFFVLFSVFISSSLGPLASLDKQSAIILLAVGNIAGISGIYGGITVFRLRMKDMERLDLIQKLDLYKSAMILRIALIEGATFFFIIIYLLNGSLIALTEAFVFIALMVLYFPTVMRISQEIGQDPRELR